jgi:hypothetical protein
VEKQQRAGLGNSPRTILEELARIQSHDVVLPTATHGQIRLRCTTQPDPAQAALLDRLGTSAQTHAPQRSRVADAGCHRLNTDLDQKCSDDFLAKALICLSPTVDSAQVGEKPQSEIVFS